MNYRYPLYLLCASLSVQVLAQDLGQLDINGIRAQFRSDGLIAYDPASTTSVMQILPGGPSALYSGGLWASGIASDQTVHTAAMTYGTEGSDFFPGPLTTDGTASITDQISQQYDHVWRADRSDIEMHISYFNCLGDPGCDPAEQFPDGYTVPPYFYEWPAVNPNPGYDPHLAPFYDFNSDGDYDPSDGDAPCILGDQALFFVFNDKLAPHTQSGGLPLGLEVQAMPFAYTGADAALEQAVFIRYHVINRSSAQYVGARLGFYNDFDLGCADDDFIGSDVARNLTYIYNWDDTDQACNGAPGFGEQPPAFGMIFLKGPLLEPDGTDNVDVPELAAFNGAGFDDGIIDNERLGLTNFIYYNRDGTSCCNDPAVTLHYHRYMANIWKDGTPMTYGGSGYNPGQDSLQAVFMFPGDSDPMGLGVDGPPQQAWVETSQTYWDRRGLSSMGPIFLDPGEHVDLLVAYVYARSGSGGPLASVAALQQRVDSIIAFASTLPLWNTTEEGAFAGQCADYSSLSIAEDPSHVTLGLFPVPSSEQVQLRADRSLRGRLLTVHDATGRGVHTQRLVEGLNTIDVSSLANGVYSCEVRGPIGLATARLIKQ